MEFDDISYDEQSSLLYELAGQVVRHLRSSLPADAAERVLQYPRRALTAHVYTQMQDHYWKRAERYESSVSHGFTPLADSAYTATAGELHDVRDDSCS